MTAATVSERLTPGWFKTAAWVWVAVIFVASIVAVASGRLPEDDPFVTWLVILAPFFAVLAAVIATRAPGNAIAWLMGTIGTGITLGVVTDLLMQNPPERLTPVMLVVLVLNGMWWVFFMFPILLTLFLFPTGRFLTKRWRWAGWLVGLMTLALFTLGLLTDEGGPASGAWTIDNPFGFLPVSFFETYLEGPWSVGLIALAIGGLSSMVVRYRRSEADERAQIKWVLYSAVLLGSAYATSVVLQDALFVSASEEASALVPVFWGLFSLAFASVPISIAIAITRYRLYDIDLIINRSLVLGLLVGFITVVYAVVVAGVGSAVGGSSVGWSIAATALVAVVFEPVRDRVQRWVNRLVYGRRATPYEVLSDLTSRLAVTEREDGLLGRMAQRLAEGTGADRAIVWTKQGSDFTPAAYAPASDGALDPVPGLDAMPGSVVPIVHDDAVLGALSVESRRGDALTPTEQRLVEDLAGSAGLLMRRLRLDADLERKAEELEESRRRLVNAQDVERRRLERQLDEGAQQRVLGLKLQLGLAEQQARAEGAERAAALIGQMALGAQDAIDQIRALARGIYPPLLESEGLHAAVRALAEVAPVDVAVDVLVGRRYPLEVEGAVYFCVSEAVTNAVKHGEPPITVRVSDATGEIVFTVTDSGPGFDPTAVARGSGLDNMIDRLDAIGGTFTIDTTPGTRTALTGRLPLRPAEVSA
jgi:signal transduction histidine kinase